MPKIDGNSAGKLFITQDWEECPVHNPKPEYCGSGFHYAEINPAATQKRYQQGW
jgi:hypothetical protein